MKQQTQQEKLKSIGISMLALGFFPLIWFLFQAILFRELTEIISRNLLVVFALIIGSTFVFLLFFLTPHHMFFCRWKRVQLPPVIGDRCRRHYILFVLSSFVIIFNLWSADSCLLYTSPSPRD